MGDVSWQTYSYFYCFSIFLGFILYFYGSLHIVSIAHSLDLSFEWILRRYWMLYCDLWQKYWDFLLSVPTHFSWPYFATLVFFMKISFLDLTKNLEEKDGQTQLLCYVTLIRACNKVLWKLVYIGKKFVFLKKNLGI